ncbi:MAG: preprotein translocase subunit SecE [Clostridiales bacterium]|nr:preprotein translocase subunit SecE [Clostridiales bacterium]
MAQENKNSVQETKDAPKEKAVKAKKAKKGNGFAKFGKAIAKFFKDFRGETKKIVWPDAKTVLKNSGVVIATVIIVGIGIWVLDYGLSELLKFIKKFAEDPETTTTAATAAVNYIMNLV